MSKLEELCERLKELDREAAKVALEITRAREDELNSRRVIRICTSETMNELPN